VKNQTTASAMHAVYSESDSDEREQDRNTAYGKYDLMLSRNKIGDWNIPAAKPLLAEQL
jgi:hypothetical protein